VQSISRCEEMGLEVNDEKMEYIVKSGEENAGQNDGIKIGNKSFERTEQFRYLERTPVVYVQTWSVLGFRLI